MTGITRLLFVILALAGGLARAAERRVTLVDFAETNGVPHRSGGNARFEFISLPANIPVAAGRRAARITLGGVNDQRGGWFNITIPEAMRSGDVTVISLWLRGEEANFFGPVLLLHGDFDGYFCWRGPRNQARAQLDVTDDVWARYDFHLADFLRHGAEAEDDRPDFRKARTLSLALGRARDYSSGIIFEVGRVELVGREGD